MFSQILKLIPRIEFERMVKEARSEYAANGLSSWSQSVAMMFCQLGGAHLVREIPARTVVVDDRGHSDYRFFAYWIESGAFFPRAVLAHHAF
jgi:hypothetical protein